MLVEVKPCRQMIALCVGGKGPRFHSLAELFETCLHDAADVCELPNELGGSGGEKAEEIVPDEDLSVTIWACADPDRRHADVCGDLRGHLAWDAFENQRSDASVLQLMCVVEELRSGSLSPACTR